MNVTSEYNLTPGEHSYCGGGKWWYWCNECRSHFSVTLTQGHTCGSLGWAF